MTGIAPHIFGFEGEVSLGHDPQRDFYNPTFGALVSVIQPIGKQMSGEWAILVVFLTDPARSSSGGSPTMVRGDLCILRDTWLEEA